jgi:hypothetical protein
VTTHAPHQDDGLDGHLVVLGSGPKAEWGHAMQRLAQGGPLLLIDEEPPSWQTPHLAGARTSNLLDPPRVVAAARDLALTANITGVLHVHPAHARAAALIRQELDLPRPPPATVEASILRHRTAQALTDAGVDHSEGRYADSYDQALEAADQVGLPLVCKPTSPVTRYAARRVDNLRELAEAFAAVVAVSWPGTGIVIEPLLEGIEATAYCVGSPSGHKVIAISHAIFDPEAEPTLLPVEIVVDADDVCVSAIEDTVSRTLTAVAHRYGPAQIRMRITSTGPRVISITTHLSDPLIAMLIEQATGIDLIAQAGQTARGRTLLSEGSRHGAAAVRFLQGRNSNRPALDAAAHSNVTPYATLQQYSAQLPVGPLQRSGQLLVSGADYPQCTARLRNAAAALSPARLSA